jgi:hypothetical protein
MARTPRKSSKKPRKRPAKPNKYKKISKVLHADNFLYTFDFLRSDGTHQTIQVVFGDNDKGALRLARQILEGYGGYSGYTYWGWGYWGYGYAGYGYWGYAY